MKTRMLVASLLIMVYAATPAVGQAQDGLTVYSFIGSDQFDLIDMDGNIVHTWSGAYSCAFSVFPEADGTLLVTARDNSLAAPTGGGQGGRVQVLNWDSSVRWEATIASPTIRSHHDIVRMPNGNILAIVFDLKTPQEAILAGRDPLLVDADLLSEGIVEIDGTTGAIVWEWYVWDHLIQDFDSQLPNFGNPADHPEKIDLNFAPKGSDRDWIHASAIDYNPQLDQIIIGHRDWHEFWIISHDPADDGDLLYRWGNPQAYGRGTPADQKLFGQHGVHWIDDGLPGAGNILLFNNNAVSGISSRVDEIVPPVQPDGTYELLAGQAYGPAAPSWSCDIVDGASFYSQITSGAQRLPNGNTLICVGGDGLLLEVDNDCNLEWCYEELSVQRMFRALRVVDRDPRFDGYLFCLADIANDDDVVDVFDLLVLLANWNTNGPGADIAEDRNIVDVFDLLALLEQWNATCVH